MNSQFQFQYPWLLALLALLPVYAFLHGRAGRFSAVRFSRAGRSKMPPELGDALVERANLLAQSDEHRGDVDDLALLHGRDHSRGPRA